MPHFMCAVCRRPRPEDPREGGWELEGLGWICVICLDVFTAAALRVIAGFHTCSNCSVRGIDTDGHWFNGETDWYCDSCTYELRGPAGGKE
jgi:hypothetical protein